MLALALTRFAMQTIMVDFTLTHARQWHALHALQQDVLYALSLNEQALGAVVIFLDIINLFLMILQLVGLGRGT